MSWIFDWPLWVVGPLLELLLVGFSLLGIRVVRASVLPLLHVTHDDSHFTGPLVHSVMVLYGLLLALVSVNVFETYNDASNVVSAEASAVAALYRDVSCYPEPTRSGLQSLLRDYVFNTIHEAWPMQRTGRIPAGGVARMDRFQAALAAFEPKTEGEKILHAEAWRAYNRTIEERRARLDRVTSGLPGVMWLVVVLGAGISLSASFFFHVEDHRLHATLVALLATFIASVIFVTLAMDHPFRGDLGISADSYQLIYDHLMKP